MSQPRRWRPLAIVAALIVGLVLSAGIGGNRARTTVSASSPATHNQAQVTLKVWDQFTDPGDAAAANTVDAAFMAAHPSIKIRREAFATDQMRQTVKTALASGTGPDVIFYDAGPGYAGVLAQAGLIRPLDDVAARHGWTHRILAASRQGATINGKLYGLPLQVDLIGVYYNKTLMDKEGLKAPQTFDQLVGFCRQAKAKGYIPLAFSDNVGWQAFHQFSMVSNNIVGPEAMRQLLFDNQGSWNTPQMVRAIRLYFVDLQKAGCFSRNVNALGYDDANALFYTGKALMNPTGSWLVGDIERHVKKYQIAMMPFPSISGGKARVWVSGIGSAYYISTKSQHSQEAAAFLDYLVSPAATKVWTEQANFILPVKLDTSGVHGLPLYKFILDTLQTAFSGRVSLGYNIDVLAPAQFNTEMQNGFQAVLAGQRTPEQEAAALQKAWTRGMKG